MMLSVSEFYHGKVAFITGAASGIGFALATLLAQSQCHVIMTDIDPIPALPNPSPGSEIWIRQLDVQDHAAFAELFQQVMTHFQRIDFMFNNARVAIGGPVFETELGEWHQTINTSSIVGIFLNVLAPAYTTSKAAVAAFGLQLQLAASTFGIQVHTLLPCAVDTPILLGGNHGRPPHGISREKLHDYWKKHRPVSSHQFAESALATIARGKTWIILPSRWRYLPIIARLFPSFWRWYSKKLIRKQTWFKRIHAKIPVL